MTEQVRRLAARAQSLPPLAVDAVIAAACFGTIAVYLLLDEKLTWWVLALAAANAVPLLWRRQYPLAVTMLCGITTTWLAIDDAIGQFPAAQLVATYTFAALCPPLKRLIAALGTVAGISLSIVVPHDELIAIGPAGISFAVAYALGTGARARRDRIAMLEERARRLSEEHAAAATRERERIAREMHDILAHSMSLVVVQAEAGPTVVRSNPDQAVRVFDTISETAREALGQLRRALGVLRADSAQARAPQPNLDGLVPLIEGVRRTGLAATLEQHGEPRPLPPDLAATTYRIVQESLTNALKHAQARTAWVRLDWADGALRVEVRDDGRGPAPNGATTGVGLVGMRERVSAAGGELVHGPGPDGVGFRVVARLPLQ